MNQPDRLIDPDGDLYHQHVKPALDRIEGWLAEPAAQFTAWLMAQQNLNAIEGGVVEFGVYRGRYLALLYVCGLAMSRPVVGVDIFAGVESRRNAKAISILKDVLRATAQECQARTKTSQADIDADQLFILAADTLKLSAGEVTRLLGPAGAAFISVDGGHEAEHLFNDIGLSAELLAPGGIIAVDDAFNHSTPGAIEGTCRWFDTANHGRLSAFAHCYNKLFLCRSDDHNKWLVQAKRYVNSHAHLDFGQRTLLRMKENDSIGFTPRFFGIELVPFM